MRRMLVVLTSPIPNWTGGLIAYESEYDLNPVSSSHFSLLLE